LKLDSYFQKPGLNEESFSFKQRRKRMLLLSKLVGDKRCLRILDLGGTREFWIANGKFLPDGSISSVDLINQNFDLDSDQTETTFKIHSHIGDIRSFANLPNTNYDLVFSNSAIEHVGNLRDQLAVSEVVRKAGKYHFVQTPARRFPVEPHFHVPFFQFLPLWLKTFLHQRFGCGFMGREPRWLEARIACENTRLLSRRELEHLFPGSRIVPERVLGLVKSWMVTNLPDPVEQDQRGTTPS